MTDSDSTIPYGYCHCGCGQKTRLAPLTQRKYGWVKGQPIRFIHNHHLWRSPNAYLEEARGYKTPCWIWQRDLSRHGYAKYGKGYEARRTYELHNGPMPDGLETHHLCDQRACVRPDHLVAVTHKENVRFQKRVKLTMEKAERIRQLHRETSLTYKQLAKMFGVSRHTVDAILQRRIWT